ncbi:3-ketoacyl-CoA thiolase A, peroxisomal-like [Gigantopelta aegis]|uniref:3-ketoacyl-CoA thiolase A, peroxisomal-like n=1 Tax=Gigantopelta aegis TaxID=1735272 RepID=UPI001B88B8C4|nr:3-ketoacyl-CoA thiolase A, peroxisomal-like [Gigantopelta aegis]
MDRLQVVFKHLGSNSRNVFLNDVRANSSNASDVVIVSALRTPVGKSKRGLFKDTYPDDLLSAVFTAVIRDVGIDPYEIGDICVGTVNDTKPAFTARTAQVYSGIPTSVPVYTTNRQCSSGLQAFINVANSISTGVCDIGLAAGVESLSKFPMGASGGFDLNKKVFEVEKAAECLIPMGITSENVAERFGVTRLKQDQFSMESHKKAYTAQKTGAFDAEIIPVTTTVIDEQGEEKTVTVTQDEGIRPNTTLEGLAKLKPAFKEGGSTTAGNSSQISDGAAACLVCRRSEAERRRWPILGVLRSFAVVGCPPDIMGIGPAIAIPRALEKAGLTINDIDIYEINEAFASQAVYCVEKLGIPFEKVNPKGGAVALGHPLGCTGARQIATLLHELKRRGKRSYGVVSMCIGTGMGAAAVFEHPGR